MDADPLLLSRQIRQRLEGLSRAGLDRIAIGPIPEFAERPPASASPAAEPVTPPPPPAEDRPGPDPAPPPAPRRRPSSPPAPAPSTPPTVGSLFDEAGIAEPVVPPEQREEALRVIAQEIAGCSRCEVLAAHRTNTVPGEGSATARLMFVGEGPGQTEDETGRPFVGRAGQLLDDMITKGMGLRREDVFIANIVKCRPPGNRDPQPEEVRNCIGYLERQIAIVRPEFLCVLGKPASQALLNTSMPMGRLRGKWQRYKGIPTIATWHPAYLLRNPAAKKETWADLQMLMKAMGIPLPGKGKQEG
ncbi:uracil-DNA glycosylase [Tautonia sociabilis]|uniref:Type-4 uracil-DNA glycosylase n=1 Tax=Tautonia sociabilis TaxID=2080755 RepID=A0A432MCG0_9BACT|nr:uracil-DNA glycosylase [Tautonia sociabilis]RUL81747.1 uracil-DNA glycosylase [Tautonia sociabilis]